MTKSKFHNMFSNIFGKSINAFYANDAKLINQIILLVLTILWVVLIVLGFNENPDIKNKNDIQIAAWILLGLAIVFFLVVSIFWG